MEKKVLLAIGEALIDFIPEQTGCDFDLVQGFRPAVGGAPANVCGAFARLGGEAKMLTQLGDDPFGHKIARELADFGVDTSCISFTAKANTSLAFVSLAQDGNRTFSFYRNPAADMLYAPEQVEETWFERAFALHFCSVSLGDWPMRQAHERAIALAQQAGAIVSFDPNLRFPLWPDRQALHDTVLRFLPMAHVLKVSDEELEFLTGETDIQKALPKLMTGSVALVLYTCGGAGAMAFARGGASAHSPGEKVKALDTTGAGDGFIGALLWQLCRDGVTADALGDLSADRLRTYLDFSNRFCAFSVQRAGAIAAYPTVAEMR